MKQNLSKMHEDHSKEISKVMTESKVRRRSSGLHNSSMYSSGSIDIDDGHPITSSIKLTNSYVPRDISLSNEGVGSQLPTVKE